MEIEEKYGLLDRLPVDMEIKCENDADYDDDVRLDTCPRVKTLNDGYCDGINLHQIESAQLTAPSNTPELIIKEDIDVDNVLISEESNSFVLNEGIASSSISAATSFTTSSPLASIKTKIQTVSSQLKLKPFNMSRAKRSTKKKRKTKMEKNKSSKMPVNNTHCKGTSKVYFSNAKTRTKKLTEKLLEKSATSSLLTKSSLGDRKSKLEDRNNVTPKKEKCQFCDISLKDELNLFRHEVICKKAHKTFDIENDYCTTTCPICGQRFSRVDANKRHILFQHSQLLKISCDICKEFIGDVKSFCYHLKLKHSILKDNQVVNNPNSEKCVLCEQKIMRLDRFKPVAEDYHICCFHSDTYSVYCSICQRTVKDVRSFLYHFLFYHAFDPNSKRMSNEVKTAPKSNLFGQQFPQICTQCPKTFDNIAAMDLHLLTHKVVHTLDNFISAVPILDLDKLSSFQNVEDCDQSNNDFSKTCMQLVVHEFTCAINRSFNCINEIANMLNTESNYVSTKTDLSQEQLLNNIGEKTRLSSLMNNFGSCILLALEESIQWVTDDDKAQNEIEVFLNNLSVGNKADNEMNILSGKLSDTDQPEDQLDNEKVYLLSVKTEHNSKVKKEQGDFIQHYNVSFKQPRRKEDAEETLYSCKICNKTLSSMWSAKRHFFRVHNHKARADIICDVCHKKFTSDGSLLHHMVCHAKQGVWKCNYCVFIGKTMEELETHLSQHLQRKPRTCTYCFGSFGSELLLRWHLLSECQSYNTCKICGYTAKNFKDLKKHREQHAEFNCKFCDFVARTKGQLTHHVQSIHRMNIICDICGRNFSSNTSFKDHMVRHFNKTPLSCDLCEYKCSSKTSLNRHKLQHAGLRPFKCDECGYCTYTKTLLKAHKRKHADVYLYKCEFCGKQMKYFYNFKMHLKIHTGEKQFHCEYCTFGCQRRKELERHMKTHEDQNVKKRKKC